MSDHVVMPPLRAGALHGAFDTAWLTTDAATQCIDWRSSRLDVASTTPAAAALRAQLGSDAAAVTRADDSGETLPGHVRRVYLEPALEQWRAAAAAAGVDPVGDANRARRERRARGVASIGMTDADHPAVAAALASIPDMSTLRSEVTAGFKSAPYLLRSFGSAASRSDGAGMPVAPDVDRSLNMIDVTAPPRPHPGATPRALRDVSFPAALRNGSSMDGAAGSSSGTDAVAPLAACETVLRVQVWRSSGQRMAEFLALASNTLAQLRDCIRCAADGDGGAYFYIDGVVYTDLRTMQAGDDSTEAKAGRKRSRGAAATALAAMLQAELADEEESAVLQPAPTEAVGSRVVQWSHDALCDGRDTGWGPLQLGSMDTRLGSLAVRLGAHYLYAHAGGDCEHLMVFTDVRLLSSCGDAAALDASVYPRQVFQARAPRLRRCDVCAREYASLAVYGDTLAASNPAVVCATCFRVMHGDADAVDSAESADAGRATAAAETKKVDYRLVPLRAE